MQTMAMATRLNVQGVWGWGTTCSGSMIYVKKNNLNEEG